MQNFHEKEASVTFESLISVTLTLIHPVSSRLRLLDSLYTRVHRYLESDDGLVMA